MSESFWKSRSEHLAAGAVFCMQCAHYIYPPENEHPDGCPEGRFAKIEKKVARLEARLSALLAEHGQGL